MLNKSEYTFYLREFKNNFFMGSFLVFNVLLLIVHLPLTWVDHFRFRSFEVAGDGFEAAIN